jgi:type II secretory pathway component PulF
MPKYDCEVKDSKGDIIKTTLEAPNLQELANRLSDKGYYLVKAKEVKAGGGFSFGGSVSKKDMMVFTVQLATLVGAAIPLVEAVGILADQTQNMYFKEFSTASAEISSPGNPFQSRSASIQRVLTRFSATGARPAKPAGCLTTFSTVWLRLPKPMPKSAEKSRER